VWDTVEAMLVAAGPGGIHAMKDPTRGGLASALNEIAAKSGVSIWIDEPELPLREPVRAVCEIFGIDPLEVTCEGCVVALVDPEVAEEVVEAARKTRHGRMARIIGEARAERPGKVFMRTLVGGTRPITRPLGEPIPRVC
ncbi:MAG: AIR synthase-related protein, partial [Candidatus Baldrarchaeota archaeon]